VNEARSKAFEVIHEDFRTKYGEHKTYKLVKNKGKQEICIVRCIKDEKEKV